MKLGRGLGYLGVRRKLGILSRVWEEKLDQKIISESSSKGNKKESHVISSAEVTASKKDLRLECSWHVWEI